MPAPPEGLLRGVPAHPRLWHCVYRDGLLFLQAKIRFEKEGGATDAWEKVKKTEGGKVMLNGGETGGRVLEGDKTECLDIVSFYLQINSKLLFISVLMPVKLPSGRLLPGPGRRLVSSMKKECYELCDVRTLLLLV